MASLTLGCRVALQPHGSGASGAAGRGGQGQAAAAAGKTGNVKQRASPDVGGGRVAGMSPGHVMPAYCAGSLSQPICM